MKHYIEPVGQLEGMQIPDFSDKKASKDIEEECRKVAAWLDEKGAYDISWDTALGYFWFDFSGIRYQGMKNEWIVCNSSRFAFLSMTTFDALFAEVM